VGRISSHTRRKIRSPLAAHIGSRLLALRQKHGCTMRDVADGAGLTNAFVCQVENGQSCPTAETLWRLSKYFEVTPGHFFYGYEDDQ
jgi:transcriptional regulator with XRE-family HTH domain